MAPSESRRPKLKASPALVVANAGKPSAARMRAEPASQGVGDNEGTGRRVQRDELHRLGVLTRPRTAHGCSVFGQTLCHANPPMTGRFDFDSTQHLITATLIKAGGLKGNRIEYGCRAAASLRFLLRFFHDQATYSLTSGAVRQEQQVDEEQAERGAAEQPANHFLRSWVRDQNTERLPVPVPGHRLIVSSETAFNDDFGIGI